MKNKNLFVLSLFALALNACSGSGGGSGGNNPTKQGDVQTTESKESYQFVMNGCDTGKHDFSSNSFDDAKKQLCAALQDDQLNGSCAEALRQEFFNKKCSGFTWNPKYQSSEPQTPNNPPSSSHDYVKEEKVKTALKNVLVENVNVASTLAGQEKIAANQFAQDLMSCGLSYVGPKCLDYITLAGNYGGTLNEVDGKFIFYSELKIKGTGAPIAFVFTIDQIEPTVKVKQLVVSKIVKARNEQSIAEYLKDQTNLAELVEVSVVDDFQAGAWKRLQKPRDIRELFHVSKMLLEVSVTRNTYQQTKTKLVTVFQNNKNVIVQSEDTRYQEEVLSLITSEISVSSQALITICEGLLNSKSDNVQQIAAATVLNAQPNRSELKPLVLKALGNTRWDIRKKAISAISKTIKTTAEENQLLSKIDDQDEDVRKEAVKAGEKISVSEQHLPMVKQLSTSQNWSTRLEAVKILSRINTENSIKELIARMDDQDEEVRKEVVSQISPKSIGLQYVQSFSKQIASSIWSVRSDSAKFLGKINVDSSILVLIGAMNDDDEDVRKTIVDQLAKNSLKDSHVASLSVQYKSQIWSVRRDVTILLGKIGGLKSTSALIKQMSDQDEDVRNVVVTQLSGRNLTSESVPNLKSNFSSQVWSVRRDVAKLLGKIKSPASLEALQDQLTKEADDDVRKQIVASIKVVKA